MEIKIRLAQPHEAGVLTDLIMRSKRSNGYDEAFMAACYDELAITSDDLANIDYWVADAGVPCGCACLIADKDGKSGEVRTFFVDPDWQRKGIGRRLWRKLVERANALNLDKLHLDADPDAVSFYQAMGFKITGQAPSGSIAGRMLPYMTIAVADCSC